jgi:SAM-dependent methyltransferase
MKLCLETHLDPAQHYRVIDFGSQAVGEKHATHRDLLIDYDVTVTGVDIAPGPNVDVVMRKPYRVPVKSNSADVILSGQVFEHIPFFWASFLELCRVVRPGGYIFITAPSRGHRHYNVDCWRYYPDSMRALAAIGRMTLLEAHTDLPPRRPGSRRVDYAAIDARRAYWGDTVGVFQKPARYSKTVAVVREVNVWWANRVGGIGRVPAPRPVPGRRLIAESAGEATR